MDGSGVDYYIISKSLSLRIPFKFYETCDKLYYSTKSPIYYCDNILLFFA